MEIPITQSEMWRKLQDDLNEKSDFEVTKDYQYLAILKPTPVGNYLYLPYGPVADTAESFKRALESLTSLPSAKKAMFIRIEPRSTLVAEILAHRANYRQGTTASQTTSSRSFTFPPAVKEVKKTKDLNPKESWLLDLTGNDEQLKSKLPSRLLRYYRNMAKQGITIEKSHTPSDIHYLLDLQKALAAKKRISTFSAHYLETELSQPFATLYLVKQDTEILAAGLVFDDETTRYNLQGAQSDAGRRLHATGILTIQLILDAKEKGLQTFDFWGIAPEDAPDNHPWAGFTAFKKTFLGYEQDYAGTYDLVLSPLRYRLYTLLRKIRRLI
ncbi:peptidoglycan bridge formation glycyltransferase FemA/FemB family protein [Candidatus Saccharibacteria bacterium]|nr:peptidoglycan bridge formation glycyltransferase FemA/FemB family protein [Candidatus Saccharibacteria bacterium]